ncbi:MAG: acyloxyacyl hydrolase [Alcanivoracaceae bacterium]|nr:acyloxyacyl hydrolase [Alcanivoracaceae bacterium]
MNKHLYTNLLIALTTLVMSLSTVAQTDKDSDYPMLNLTAGKIGVLDSTPKKASRFGLEYRGKKISKWEIIPAYGYTWSINGSKYIYSDLKHDWNFKNNLVFTLSLGTGLFDNNDSIDLGHAIEFRSGIELTYRFKHGSRIGIAAYHLSNSRISSKNPGTESIVISYLIPLNKILRK